MGISSLLQLPLIYNLLGFQLTFDFLNCFWVSYALRHGGRDSASIPLLPGSPTSRRTKCNPTAPHNGCPALHCSSPRRSRSQQLCLQLSLQSSSQQQQQQQPTANRRAGLRSVVVLCYAMLWVRIPVSHLDSRRLHGFAVDCWLGTGTRSYIKKTPAAANAAG